MFDNFVAGFSKFPPSAAWKLSNIHCTTWRTFDTTWKEKEQYIGFMENMEPQKV